MRLPVDMTDSLSDNASYVMQTRVQQTMPPELGAAERSLKHLDDVVWDSHQRHWKDQLKRSPQLPTHRSTEEISTEEIPPPNQPVKIEFSPDIPTQLPIQAEVDATHKGWIAAILHFMMAVPIRTLSVLMRAGSLVVCLTPFAALVWFMVCAAFQVPPIPKAAMTSLCEINVLSRTYVCVKTSSFAVEPSVVEAEPGLAQWADFPTLMMVQNAIADTFTGDTPAASEMALQITKAELATSDLIAAIRYSNLRTAMHLADSLTTFVRDAVDVADSLQELDAKAMGAIDSVLGINTWALQTIQQAHAANSGAMSLLASWRTKKTTKEVINEKFNEAMTVQSVILSGLVMHAKHSQGQLKRMKEQLQAIRDLATMENSSLNAEQAEFLASMWTQVGGNRRDLQRFATNLDLLKNLEKYTDEAKIHIAQALSNLKTMQSQMKDLRNKVSQPDIAGTSIPVDVHIRTIMDGIHRMKEGRIRAREREGDIRTIGA